MREALGLVFLFNSPAATCWAEVVRTSFLLACLEKHQCAGVLTCTSHPKKPLSNEVLLFGDERWQLLLGINHQAPSEGRACAPKISLRSAGERGRCEESAALR